MAIARQQVGPRPIGEALGAVIVGLDRVVAKKAGKTVIQNLADTQGWEAPEEGTERYRMLDLALASRGMGYRFPIFGATAEQEVWLKKVAAVTDWQWGWVFYRRQDDEKGHAPVVKPILRSPRDATYLTGERKTAVALQNYQTFVARFGFDVPWAVVEVTEEPQDHEFPPWLERIHEPIAFPEPLKDAA